MTRPLKILVVGGYGAFGGRIVELLEGTSGLSLIVAGRSLEKAEAYCKSRGTVDAELIAERFDREGDAASALKELSPDLLVDASGPFQAYGEGAYQLIEAAIGARVHYLDIADGSDFVHGVAQFDEAAKQAGVYVLSGMSSFPVLTAAVVRRISDEMREVSSIRAGVAPTPYADVGLNVINAIASYAGQDIRLKRGGRWTSAAGLTEQIRYTIAVPGKVPLRNTLFSLVDVPDLQMLPAVWPKAQTVWTGAGPGPESLHRLTIGFALLVKHGFLRSLTPITPLMHKASKYLRWGEDRGGMFVEAEGRDATGKLQTRSWHLQAEGKAGPFIPSMAVAAVVRRVLEGRIPAPGARAGIADVDLADYEALFSARGIITGMRGGTSDLAAPIYEQVLDEAWDNLPRAIRSMHEVSEVTFATGHATVERGRSFLSRTVAALVGFPAAGADRPLRVSFRRRRGKEWWVREFGRETFHSRQWVGEGRWTHLLCEQFGPAVFAMALLTERETLTLKLRYWRFLGIPMPLWLAPRAKAQEDVDEHGRFRFAVELSHPLTGLIVSYRGWLSREE